MSKWSEGIVLDDKFYDEELDSTIIFFSGPVSLLENPNPEDIESAIRIEYAYHGMPDDAMECDVMIAHTKEDGDVVTDYDWEFFDITQEQYEELKDIVAKAFEV